MKTINLSEKKQDLKEIKEFTKKFEERFKTQLKAENYVTNSFRDYINYGAESIYVTPRPESFVPTKWRKSPQEGMLWIETGINPNGVTGKDDIARTYSIKFEQKLLERRKYARQWHTGIIFHYYGYGRTMEEALDKFQEYLNKKL